MNTKEVRAVLFDLDGTLIEGRSRLHLSFLLAFRQMGIEEPDEQSYWEAYRSFDVVRFVPRQLRDRFFALALDHYSAYPGEVELIPGALETLRFCQDRGFGTAVVTSRRTSSDHVRQELERASLSPFIEVVKTHLGVSIPSVLDKEERLLEAVAELGTTPERSLFVGDLPEDISSARRAGLGIGVAVLTGGICRELLAAQKPDVILNSVSELPGWLGG